ncbi:MAG: hypothetical protein JXA14_11195 [Anaerolineae bacterium]|nr:hypothetical protein [Anaerolineae bacterium]
MDINLRYSGTDSKLRLKIRAGAEHRQETLEREAEASYAKPVRDEMLFLAFNDDPGYT